MAVAASEGAIPFDVEVVELGHHGDKCSFDAVIEKDALTAPGLDDLALIVRGADTAAKDLTPESRGLEAIADGFRAIGKDYYDFLRLEFPVYDAPYAYCKARIQA